VTVAITSMVATLAFAVPASAATIFSDGFESSDFHNWSPPVTAGDGTATVQTAIVRTGALAAQLSESATSGSKAYVRKTLSAAQTELTATGDFRVVKEGASGGNVPFFRFFDPGSSRILSVYRQNAGGSIQVGIGSVHSPTSASLGLNTWATISVHVIVNGASSTIDVNVNGAPVYHTGSAALSGGSVATIQIGNDTAAQAFNLVADTISVDGGASTATAPVNTVPPDISGTPQSGMTLTASTGTWGGSPTGYAYQWRRCGSSGGNCVDIAGAAARTYAVTDADVGATLRVAVTATNDVGSSTAVSPVTTVVQSGSSPPVNTAAPVIAGNAVQGQTLNVNPGTWTGTQPMTFTQQWRRCDSTGAACTDIAGATSASYTLVAADVGHTLRAIVTAANSAGTAGAASNATGVVSASSNTATLVASWHMDETSGTVMHDATSYGHDGTLFSVQLGVLGFNGTAYGFNGSSSYVSVPHASDLNPGSSNLTITMHIKTTSRPATPDWDLIRKGLYTTSGGEFKMEYQPTGQASCGFKGSSNYGELITGPAIDDGQWHIVQCIKTASAVKVVIDGQVFSKTITIGSIANTEAVPIGSRVGSEYFKGSLDESSIQIG
jgi:hypothetical protein